MKLRIYKFRRPEAGRVNLYFDHGATPKVGIDDVYRSHIALT